MSSLTVIDSSEKSILSTLSSRMIDSDQHKTWSACEYVVHTSSIPLATTANKAFLLKKFGNECQSLFHGTTTDDPDGCSKRSCMHIKHDHTRSHDTVARNCPCLRIRQEDDTALKPRCFIAYLRMIGTNLIEDPDSPSMAKEKIVFCYDSWNILSKSYSGPQRDWTTLGSWDNVNTVEKLHSVLTTTYWYSKRWKSLKLLSEIELQTKRFGFSATKAAVEQTLFTINGLLVKKFLAFPVELSNYRQIAEQTAFLFRDLLKDYGKTERQGLSVYEEIKKFLQFVKAGFHLPTKEAGDWLSYDFKDLKTVKAFFWSEMTRLRAKLQSTYIGARSGYLDSIAWFHRSITMSQTRVLGYLPRYLAEEKRAAYRASIARPLEQPPVEKLLFIRKAIPIEMNRSEIPYKLLSAREQDPEWSLKAEIISAVDLDLRDSASYDHYVREGGKMEDARLILKSIRDNDLKIPVRDLRTDEIKEYLTKESATIDSKDTYQRVLFWYAYLHIRNGYLEALKKPADYLYTKSGEKITHLIFHAKIVHISEPGKERNLTKSSALLSWFLTPGAKILQRSLALAKEHRAGLTAAGHDWRHQKRISSLSDEAHFIYDSSTGRTQSNIYHSFKDWTEATDFIGKLVGLTHLRAFMEYLDFPGYYGKLIQFACSVPQPVTEWIVVANDITTASAWDGHINEGFMMGNPITKVILHLVHSSERQAIFAYLERVFGNTLEPGRPFRRTGHARVEIDPKLISRIEPGYQAY